MIEEECSCGSRLRLPSPKFPTRRRLRYLTGILDAWREGHLHEGPGEGHLSIHESGSSHERAWTYVGDEVLLRGGGA